MKIVLEPNVPREFSEVFKDVNIAHRRIYTVIITDIKSGDVGYLENNIYLPLNMEGRKEFDVNDDVHYKFKSTRGCEFECQVWQSRELKTN